MSSTSSKKWALKNLFRAYGVCGCRRTKKADIVEPKPKTPTQSENQKSVNEDEDEDEDEGEDDCTSTTFSFSIETQESDPKCSKMVSPCPKISDSVAIVKDSEDPYQDFRQSMLQMILEREIYSRDDLRELLNCFLELNSPQHHEIIVKAFFEIWNSVHPKTPAATPTSASASSGVEEMKSSVVVLPEEPKSRDT